VGVWLIFLLIGVAAIVGGYLHYQYEQKRQATLLNWALKNNWQIVPEDDSQCARWAGPPFNEGDHRRARNVLSGEWRGRPFVSFDYSYETHSSNSKGGQTTQVHRYAVSALALPTWLPRLQVTPENTLTRIGNALGHTDIELESEDFNRAFRVTANDPKFASDVLTPRTMQLLLGRPHFSWRIEGADILCWQSGEQQPVAVNNAVNTLVDVIDGIPSFVWHDHGYDAGSATVGGSS
jgi:hypothetical protein